MQKKTEGICFAISAGICWGSMGVAAQVLMEDSGFAVGDLVAGRLLGAGALLLMFEHFFMRRSLLKYFSQPGVAKDILLYGVLVLLTQLTFFLAIQCSNAGTAAILAATIPVFTTIWDIFVKHRAPQIREMACTALAIIAVVLITTKGGRKDQPTQVSFDASVSFNGPTTRPTYMNSMQYATWMNTAQQNTVGRDYFDAEWMQHIEAYYKDPVNNSPVFIHSDPSISKNGTKYTYAGYSLLFK